MSLWNTRYFNVHGGLPGNISLVHRRQTPPVRRPICIRVLSSFEKNIPTQPPRAGAQLLRHTSPSAWYWWLGKRLSKSHTRIIYKFVVVYLPRNLFHALFSKAELMEHPAGLTQTCPRRDCIILISKLIQESVSAIIRTRVYHKSLSSNTL